MKKGVLAIGLLFGVLCACCVALFAFSVQQDANSAREEAMARYGGEQVDVLVATQDVYPGETLNSSNCSTQTWLSDLLPNDCVTNFNDVRGKEATSLILEGEAISFKRFASNSTSLDIPQGCVALSVPAEDVQAVGGVLRAGMTVDVYAVGTETTRIGEGLLVLATNTDKATETDAKVSWVTLAVPLEQSQEFVTASQSMEIYFTLPADNQQATLQDDQGLQVRNPTRKDKACKARRLIKVSKACRLGKAIKAAKPSKSRRGEQ